MDQSCTFLMPQPTPGTVDTMAQGDYSPNWRRKRARLIPLLAMDDVVGG
jgi:hypothetical protein